MQDAPKVSIEEINAAIKKTEFILLPDNRTTICMLTLDNGFTVRGEASCVSLKNYNQNLGEHYSREDAISKVWVLMGFRLADRLHQAKMRKRRGPRYRDAKSGLYVETRYAKLNPKTTVREN